MMPFLHPFRPAPFPVLVIANNTYIEEEETDDDGDNDADSGDEYIHQPPSAIIFPRNMSIPTTAVPRFVSAAERPSNLVPPTLAQQSMFRLRMHVDGFQPDELKIFIRHGRLIIRGKHVVRTQIQPIPTTTMTMSDDDMEPDFVAKEFKRTFILPPNADVRKARANFHPQQQMLVIEVPFQEIPISSRSTRIRPIDIFLTVITILLMDRALRITYEQFMLNELPQHDTSSQHNPFESTDIVSRS